MSRPPSLTAIALPSLNLSNPFLDPLLHSSVIDALTDTTWQWYTYGRNQACLNLLKKIKIQDRVDFQSLPSLPALFWGLGFSAPLPTRGCFLPPLASSAGRSPARRMEAGWSMLMTTSCSSQVLKWPWCCISHKGRWAEDGPDKSGHTSAVESMPQGPDVFCSTYVLHSSNRPRSKATGPFKICPFGVATTPLMIYLCLALAEAVALLTWVCSWFLDIPGANLMIADASEKLCWAWWTHTAAMGSVNRDWCQR